MTGVSVSLNWAISAIDSGGSVTEVALVLPVPVFKLKVTLGYTVALLFVLLLIDVIWTAFTKMLR